LVQPSEQKVDVAIVGGGPAGTTVASLLRKYNPDLDVQIVEKEVFPREHIGESQLPIIGHVLNEMGCWDKVEAAEFPIKIGATFTWGRDWDRWDFDFYPAERFQDEPRPAKFEGQRVFTAFQVDRAIYDKILLDHARELGAHVDEGVKVERVRTEGDRITGLETSDGRTIVADHYVDASGGVGLLRRALGVESEAPHELRNIAIWDYWRKAEWAIRIGVGGTRIQVRSLPWGWVWFIPLGPTRTSIGLVCPAEHYKNSGKSPEELYREALQAQPEVAELIKNAEPEGDVKTIKDWSHLAGRISGENWFLVGESAGFADPILSAGMSLAHWTAREAAYTILELERGELDAAWLRRVYNERNRASILQHIRFALYWYSANSCFTDLKDHCQRIAKDAGLKLTPAQAWRWLAQGGFVNHDPNSAAFGSFDLAAAKGVLEHFAGAEADYSFHKYNVFRLNLHGAERGLLPKFKEGRIEPVEAFLKAGKTLPTTGYFGAVLNALQKTPHIGEFFPAWRNELERMHRDPAAREKGLSSLLQALEAMVLDGWIMPSRDKKRPILEKTPGAGGQLLRRTEDGLRAMGRES